MSDWKLSLQITLLAALLAPTIAGGCKVFQPQAPAASDGISSPSDVRQASFESDDPEQKGLSLEDFYPDKIAKTAKRLVTEPPNKKEASKTFDEADAAFRQAAALPAGDERQRLYLEGAREFSIAAERFPNSALEQDSLFLAGECYFFADYYWEANRSYEKLIKAYPNNRYLDTVEARRF